MRLVVVGGGRMGEALVAGLLDSGWAAPGEVAVVEPVGSRRETLTGRFPSLLVVEDVAAVDDAVDGAVVAVKPGDVATACAALAEAKPARVLSIAAGVSLSAIEAALGLLVPVVRAMPNTAALVGAGAAAIAGGSHAGPDDLAWAEEVLGAVGVVVRVPERLLDAVTGLSGSGPAYVFLVAEALVEGGVAAGLPRDVAATLVAQTVLGSGRLLVESGETADELRAAVTSPGGTTAAGLRALEAAAVRSALIEAVLAATDRSRELGQTGKG